MFQLSKKERVEVSNLDEELIFPNFIIEKNKLVFIKDDKE